ncbi:MAG: hypothetical protein KAH72_02630 [Flavobacteriaceae bacterium]|nr:hypothetical protein [Flavobacteriaceae bacterium]
MKKLTFNLIGIFIIISLFFVSCKQNKTANNKTTIETEKVAINEFEVLAIYLENNGDFINSKTIPAMITSKEVYENINNEKYKIIDTRKSEDFTKGHIKNAINISSKDMISHFENMTPDAYNKIVMVCYSGQSSSYVTSIMRLLGYNNVFAMKAGMSSWNKDLSKEYWSKNISNDFADQLEEVPNDKPAKGEHPTLKTGKTKAKDILKIRAQEALNTPYKSLLIKAPELFNNSADYYIVNYWPEAKYNEGHIPESFQYTPKKSLSISADLYTLPSNKEIVTYCFTGQHAAFVTGYLKILGYNAKALAYGANSFMNTEMKNKEDDWHAFSSKKIANYKVVVE